MARAAAPISRRPTISICKDNVSLPGLGWRKFVPKREKTVSKSIRPTAGWNRRVGWPDGWPNEWRTGVPLLLAVLILAGLAPASSDAQNSRRSAAPEAKFAAGGAERCLFCHGGESMTVMAETAHGHTDDPHTPYAKQGCESCHGPGSLHASRARGGAGFPALLVFGENEALSRQTEACIACHGEDMGDLEGIEWAGSAHDTDDMTCVSCHRMHVVGNALQSPEPQRESCAECHSKQITSHSRFEDKGIVFDKLSCFDCHDVHQLIREP